LLSLQSLIIQFYIAMKNFFLLYFLLSIVVCGCGDKPDEETPIIAVANNYLSFDLTSAHEIDIESLGSHAYKLKTTGLDPYISVNGLKKKLTEGHSVLTFEYTSATSINFLQVFFAPPTAEERSQKSGSIAAANDWKVFSLDVGETLNACRWGEAAHFLRLDFGDLRNVELNIRNISFRARNEAEEEALQAKEAFRAADAKRNGEIADYLARQFDAKINSVEVNESTVIVQGQYAGEAKTLLCEVTLWDDVTQMNHFESVQELTQTPFRVEIERYAARNGHIYDRVFSKWVIVRDDKLISHARFADLITPSRNMLAEKPASRKGLGGFGANVGFTQDLDDLPITSVTINIVLNDFMYSSPRSEAIAHTFSGRTYYFAKNHIDEIDRSLQATAERNIVVSAIILVRKASESPDPTVGALLQDKNCTEDGIFAMPDMYSEEGIMCYAAGLDFLANRYCRSDKTYGRIHHWIMHNEIDAGSTWTNMGKDRPLLVYLDAYYKSMRLCNLIARRYDEHSEVLASFTHSWAKADPGGDYATLDLINGLLKYSAAEGDFKFGLACHPYPEDLNEPKTWNDPSPTFSMNTPLVTFKNLEVLDAWIKLPENKYLGTQKRTLWLSENGTNSRTYSEKDLAEQAAGMAYTWKKFKHLDGIDAFQWHNWIDNRAEYGLRIGLRRFRDDETDPGGRKPVWFVYQAAGSDNEDAVFEQYKSVTGITDWSEVLHVIR